MNIWKFSYEISFFLFKSVNDTHVPEVQMYMFYISFILEATLGSDFGCDRIWLLDIQCIQCLSPLKL